MSKRTHLYMSRPYTEKVIEVLLLTEGRVDLAEISRASGISREHVRYIVNSTRQRVDYKECLHNIERRLAILEETLDN
jgi:predicted HTH domain antitoxin